MQNETQDLVASFPTEALTHQGKEVRYVVPNFAARWRVETFYTKEPDTVAWIASFQPGDILFDIGANVGMYSIWAAATRGVRVYSFEPESLNYALLNQNIHANKLSGLISAYCLALSDKQSLNTLFMSHFVTGGSSHNFGEAIGPHYQPFKAGFEQGAFSIPLDVLVGQYGLPVPTHIKIDVDGIEPKIVAGAQRTIVNPAVKSVLIEINTALDDHWEIIDFMIASGYNYSEDQIKASIRTEGAFKGVGNYVFRR